MYKIYNPYEGSILSLNLMEAQSYRRNKCRKIENYLFGFTLLAVCIGLASIVMGDLSFMADCTNIQGGDICRITMN